MAVNIGPKIGIDGEAQFRKELNNIIQQSKTLESEMKAVTSAFDANDNSQEKLTAQSEVLKKQLELQQKQVEMLEKGVKAATDQFGDADSRTQKWKKALYDAQAQMNNTKKAIDNLENSTDDVDQAMQDTGQAVQDAGKAMKDAKDDAFSFGDALKANLISGAIIEGVKSIVGALGGIAEKTEEYRIAQGKLNTAFEAAGHNAEQASRTYSAFYQILGDTDTATEASQLLAKLSSNGKDMIEWTTIAAGVAGTFGDSLPIEGLIESANETAKVGEVTGSLADALNWAGINEDDFNEKLAECTDESDRNQLIMETLSDTYDDASDAFYRNNKSLMESRRNQIAMDEALADLGGTVSDIKNSLLSQFLPAISDVTTAFSDLLAGTEGADESLAAAIESLVQAAVEKLPEFLSFGVQIITSLISGIVQNIPSLIEQVPVIIGTIISTLSEAWPQIEESGKEILSMLTNGLRNGIPQMMEALPEVITSFLNYLTENLPSILAMGTDILESLTQGILDGIPKFLEKLPEMITAFVGFISENLPEIAKSGIDIIVNLAQGIIDAIPDLVERLPEIITAIATGIFDLKEDLIDIGGDIVGHILDGVEAISEDIIDMGESIDDWIIEGLENTLGDFFGIGEDMIEELWKGISSGAKTFLFGTAGVGQVSKKTQEKIKEKLEGPSNLKGSPANIGQNMIQGLWEGIYSAATSILYPGVASVGSGVKETIQNRLGIHSPSRVFRDEVGKMIPPGIAIGIEQAMPAAIRQIDSTFSDLVSATSKPIPQISMEESANRSINYNGGINISVQAAPGMDINVLVSEIERRLAAATARREAVW